MDKIMERNDLQALTQAIDRKYFTMFDFSYHGQVIYNKRLRSTGGQYRLADDTITVNPKMFQAGMDTIEGILKHELCHYYIHHLDTSLPAHGTDFKRLLYRVGGNRYAPRLPKKIIYRNFYQCKDCGCIFGLTKPLIFEGSFHGTCVKCHGDIEMIKHQPSTNYELYHRDITALVLK